MPQSLARVLIHIIFSTKNRVPWLKHRELREAMNGYLVGALQNLDCSAIAVGAAEDHVHILCHLSRTLSIAGLLEESKRPRRPGSRRKIPPSANSIGRAVTASFPSAPRTSSRSSSTLPTRKSIIARFRSRMSSARFSNATALHTTSVTFGIRGAVRGCGIGDWRR